METSVVTNEQKMNLIKKTKEALKLAIQSSMKHSKNVAVGQTHTTELLKIHKEDRATILRLNNVIDMKQREIDKVNAENIKILWEMAKLEKELAICEQHKKVASKEAEKERLHQILDDKRTDN